MTTENDNPDKDRFINHIEEVPRTREKDTKRLGDIAELTFVLKAASLGITASKPFGDRRPYDFLVECGQKALRIQVKSVFARTPRKNHAAFPCCASRTAKSGKLSYTSDQIDFIAAYVAVHDAWYVIPVESLSGRKFVHLYPAGKKRAHAGRFEEYHEAWHLLKPEAK